MAFVLRHVSWRRWALLAGLAFLWPLSAGCSRDPYPTVRISGRVAYDDGSLIPARHLVVYFEPQRESIDPKTTPRRGYAEVDMADGTFSSATTYAPGDGVISGEHKVTVEALGEDGTPDYRYFPREYGNPMTTPLRIDVGSVRTFELQLPRPR